MRDNGRYTMQNACTLGRSVIGSLGNGLSLMGTSGMKWLYPELLQAITIGELGTEFVQHSSGL